jgi:PAS domain S-box-containing protein
LISPPGFTNGLPDTNCSSKRADKTRFGAAHTVSQNFQSLAIDVLNAIPDPVVMADADFRIRSANQHALTLFGSGCISGLDSRADDLFDSRSRETIQQLIRDAFRQDGNHTRSESAELLVRTSDGSRFTAEVDVNTIGLDETPTVLIAIRDISQHKRIENELRTNQMLLAEAQRVAQLGSWRWDIADDQVHWSGELYRLFGLDPEGPRMNFEDYMQLIHPADRDRVSKIIQEAVANSSSFEMEHRIVRPDGIVRLIYGQGAAGLTETGELASLIGTAQDVTERKANEAQAFQLALEQAARQEAERTKERFQFLAEVSEALSTSLEYETTLGKMMRLIIPRQADWCTINTIESSGKINRLAVAHRNPDKQQVLEAIRERGFLPHGDDTHPLTRALKDGKPQLHTHVTNDMLERMARSTEHMDLVRQLNPTSVMLVPLVARGRAFGIVTFGMSDSGRRYTEDDLQLAMEVAHRAAVSIDNAHLYQEAQEAARAREEFVSLVSHELKTPLTVIKGYIQVMERYLERPDWERDRIRTSRERLSTQVDRLELLVADILDVSRMQRGRLDLNVIPDTDLVDLARQVMDRFDDALERRPDHQMIIEADGPVLGCWDPLRLDQVFSNLLSNALKYSPDGGAILVTISSDDSHANVSVQDNGVGISAEEKDQLFQPFQRGAAAARGISGTGLGLYITRQIIEQHGGTIGVDSSPEHKTTFRFTLPLKPDLTEYSPEQPTNSG